MVAEDADDLTPERAAAQDRAFHRGVVLAVGAVLLVAIVLGFVAVALPIVQGQAIGLGVWASICRAIGVRPGSPIARQPHSDASAFPVSQVSWGPMTLGGPSMKQAFRPGCLPPWPARRSTSGTWSRSARALTVRTRKWSWRMAMTIISC